MGNFFNFFQKKSPPINSKDISTEKKKSVEKNDSLKLENISDYEKEVQKNKNKILFPKTILDIRDALIFFNTSVASNKSFEKLRLETIENINEPLINLGLNLEYKIPTNPKDQNLLWNKEIAPKLSTTWQSKAKAKKDENVKRREQKEKSQLKALKAKAEIYGLNTDNLNLDQIESALEDKKKEIQDEKKKKKRVSSKKKGTKNIEVLWKKKFWDRVLDPIPASKRLLVNKYLSFDEFVCRFTRNNAVKGDLYDATYLIKITGKIMIGSRKFDRFVEQDGRYKSTIKREITNTGNFIKKYIEKNKVIFQKVLVEEGLWPIDDKEAYEQFGESLSNLKEGFVYFIKNEEIYKIGITDNLMRRLNQLKPDEVINTVKCKNYESLEKQLHNEFKKYRIPQTEYFRLSPALVQQVNKKMTEGANF